MHNASAGLPPAFAHRLPAAADERATTGQEVSLEDFQEAELEAELAALDARLLMRPAG